ncbi:MAG: hypothetical protein HJJLKODD_02478 [Phycisphaerae bacterium]|nr:hypothetical protein [Phycisphaerae bacterium]
MNPPAQLPGPDTPSPAFSLVELIIVMVILGILAAIAIPKLSSASDNALLQEAKANARAIQKAIDAFTLEHPAVAPKVSQEALPSFAQKLRIYLYFPLDSAGCVETENRSRPAYLHIPPNPLIDNHPYTLVPLSYSPPTICGQSMISDPNYHYYPGAKLSSAVLQDPAGWGWALGVLNNEWRIYYFPSKKIDTPALLPD